MLILKNIFPALALEIEKVNEGEDLKIEATPQGAPTLVTKGVYVHSKRDPEREAERLVEAESSRNETPDSGESAALILGFGLGYAAVALAAKFPSRPIIVVEKRLDILKKALETRDLASFLSRQRLVFVLDSEGVSEALSLFESSSFPLVIWNRTLTALDEEWYSLIEERIKTWNSRANVNRVTQKRFGERWVRNLSKNLEYIRDTPGISRLESILKEREIPVFLAAAGPSLDSSGPILSDIYQRCLVIATDTSLRYLSKRGIKSDFVVSVDPQYWNFRHLDQLPSPKTCLIAESAVYPPVLRHQFKGIFLCSSLFPIGRFIEDRLEPKGDLGAGGSVATSAWDFIRFLGSKDVWISGLDLSFPEFKTHFSGALFEELSHSKSSRFAPAETWNSLALRSGQPFMAKRASGGTVLTDNRLSLYALWFENRFRQFPAIRNHCLSGEGLAIKGLEIGTKEELLYLPERREEIDTLLENAYSSVNKGFYSGEVVKFRRENFEKALESLLKGLNEIKSIAQDAEKQAGNALTRNKMGHLHDEEREKTLKHLDTAYKSISESVVKEVAGFLFPEIDGWEAEISSITSDPLARHLEFLKRFYKALADATDNNLLYLSKVLKPKTDIQGNGREILH